MLIRVVMEVLGILMIAALAGGGVVWIIQNVWIKQTTPRYRFTEKHLSDGSVKREVIDLETDEVEIVKPETQNMRSEV